jgi:hypothetical protein
MLTREQAIERFRALVARYGLQWDASVPRAAYEEMNEINKVLINPDDRRAALGLPTKPRNQ